MLNTLRYRLIENQGLFCKLNMFNIPINTIFIFLYTYTLPVLKIIPLNIIKILFKRLSSFKLILICLNLIFLNNLSEYCFTKFF